jgi:FkbM family methyltransferase
VIDVGAHHGFDTVLFSRWVGVEGRVIAIEANPENAMVLAANVAVNRLDNCTTVHAAVGATTGRIRLEGETVTPGDPAAREVALTSLDDYAAAAGLQRADLVKIDVEGFEAAVLKGAPKLLASLPSIALELHIDLLARYGTKVDDVLALLDLARYEGTMMVRPDWETLRAFHGPSDVPPRGIVNLFLRPIRRPASGLDA